jgi:hypothetical protein
MACQRIEQGAVARAPEFDLSSSLAVITADAFAALTSPVWPFSRATWGPLLHVPDDRCVVDAAMVQASTQDKGAASTDLTAESGAAPAQTLAADWPAPTVSKPTAEQDQAERTDREALALAQLYALYLSAHRTHNTHGYSYSHGYGYG